jgi:hypothetical protein
VTDRRIYFPGLLPHHQPAQLVWLNAVRTKLAAEGYQCSEPVLLLFGQSIDFYYRSFRVDGCWNLSAKSPQLLQNLAASLGMYLEDFHTERLDRLYEEVRKTLSLYWLPMIEVSSRCFGDAARSPAVVPDLLLLITGLSTDGQALIVLHPERQEYVHLSRALLTEAGRMPSSLPLREGRAGWRWLLLNSPSPIRPVFPPLRRSLFQAMHGWAHRFLYTRTCGGGVGETGKVAFERCIADLHWLAAGAAAVEPAVLIERFSAITGGEFGPTWGRDVQARGLREAAEILGCDLEQAAVLYDELADHWSGLTDLLLALPDGATAPVFRETANRMQAIAALETQAAYCVLERLSSHQEFSVPAPH